MYDSSIEGKETNMTHVDYKYTTASTQERNIFGKLVDAEFKLRGWSKMYNGPSGMRPITLGNKVAKLKESLLEGAVVIQLRDSIEYNRSIVDEFSFPQSLAIPCILPMENRVNKKIISSN